MLLVHHNKSNYMNMNFFMPLCAHPSFTRIERHRQQQPHAAYTINTPTSITWKFLFMKMYLERLSVAQDEWDLFHRSCAPSNKSCVGVSVWSSSSLFVRCECFVCCSTWALVSSDTDMSLRSKSDWNVRRIASIYAHTNKVHRTLTIHT